jgi:IPT/TIG domain-containing protein
MSDDKGGSFNIIAGVLCFGAFVLLFWMLGTNLTATDPTIQLPVLVITGVMALFASLAIVAVAFSVAGLSDDTQALGLPEGSVRAAIALSLIVVFAITIIYFYASMKDAPANAPSVDFAKQVFAVLGTLVTSVSSFYFGSRAATPEPVQAAPSPTLSSITPATGAAGGTVPAKIAGTDLRLAKAVNLQSGASSVQATDVLSNDSLITCTLALDAGLPKGKYDVVVTMADDSTAKLPAAFEVA